MDEQQEPMRLPMSTAIPKRPPVPQAEGLATDAQVQTPPPVSPEIVQEAKVGDMPTIQAAIAQLPAPGQRLQSPVPGVTSVGGIMEIRSLSQLIEDEKRAAAQDNQKPMIAGLAAHIKKCWLEAKQAKEEGVEKQMLRNLRQRRGEYEPELLADLRRQGAAIVYMLLTSNKCRSASAWLREALADMPWSCEPTPIADIDDDTKGLIVEFAQTELEKAISMGVFPSQAETQEFMVAVRDQVYAKVQEVAKDRAERMTEKMKDQLHEGGFDDAMDAFIDDLVTFPAAILKGPVVRIRPQLKWVMGQDGRPAVTTTDAFRLEWERVDPFDLYPVPDATTVDDGYLIERHRLSRQDLVDLREVEGYSAPAINAVLDQYGHTGNIDLTQGDSERRQAEGKHITMNDNPSGLIEALQYWGSVQGKMLLDWGVSEAEIEDPLADYHVEVWMIGDWVIKATLNPDPLHRKPYYKTSWENIPGSFWGKAIPDLCADTQAVCNAAARALVNNMSLSSGPQVAYDISRLPTGENLTQMYPWKVWQFRDLGNGGSVQPISFFQPQSNAAELMGIYDRFAALADEYTGIPRYMTGDGVTGGAGRTASGMQMLMTNAGKSIKNVVSSVDRILKPAIERLYFYNMMYLDDNELKGDVNIIAKGAYALVQKQQQQQRQNEILSMVAANPVLSQIAGPEGVAYLFRELIKNTGVDVDKIVPDLPVLRARMAMQQVQQQAAINQQIAMQQQMAGQPQAGGTPAKPDAGQDGRVLADGSPQATANANMRMPGQ